MVGQTIEQRLMEKVSPEPNSGCWLWMGALHNDGYGVIRIGTRSSGAIKKAHRVSYETFIGTIPNGLEIDHLCRVRCCINPHHLEPVTPEVNRLRGFGVSRLNEMKTHCVRGHEFTEANTLHFIHRGKECRRCKRCTVDQCAQRYKLKKLKGDAL